MRIEARLRDSVRRFAAKTALVVGDHHLTYAELDAFSDRLAHSLISQGVQHGDRVLMLLENGTEAVVSFFGIWKAGAVACPLHPSTKADKLAAIIDSTDARVLITQARHRNTAGAAVEKAISKPLLVVAQGEDSGVQCFEDMMTGAPDAPLPVFHDCDELALLIHTSGSTGLPKGVMLSHVNIDAACTAIARYLKNSADDVVLSVLPLSHGYGITQMVTMASVGGTLVLEKSFAFPRKAMERLAEVKATGFPLVPAMAAMINGMTDLPPGSFPHLRYVTSAAAAMPPTFIQRLQQLLPQTELFIMYGQTECLRATYLPPDELERRPLSVGKAIPGTRAFVVDEDGLPVPPGVVGELVIEGPHVMRGYWGDGLATVRAFQPTTQGQRLRTGDLFSMDEDGFLYFISRSDDIIKTRGEKVSPQEVERALYALPGIKEAAVGGIDDPIFGQTIRAYVVLCEGAMLSERDIIRHCAGVLEDFMVPKSVEFRDALPRTPTGKIRLSADKTRSTEQGNVA
ncbi:acyl--CoA ligase [Rhizobium sp. NTR19]|uniref:Acyl--CoA ligase n=1 Tax=Neorhizobium turbinariae TaxID=2937795 RepID=A0ABT0IQX3_9HYPH|nr:class I adenylate-forming enzyme family protein [Neorhizobium turbinariae]MCK8780275.1 acyl--CoA ligase [Neorhizobium turbinariae]